jgi:hypothetical protein
MFFKMWVSVVVEMCVHRMKIIYFGKEQPLLVIASADIYQVM